MTSYLFQPPTSVITNGDMSTASITSTPLVIQQLSLISFQTVWSGSSPVGALQVQTSNDFALNGDGSVRTAGTWTNVGSSVAVSGNSGSLEIALSDVPSYAIRIVYTKTSGTGTLQCLICGKA